MLLGSLSPQSKLLLYSNEQLYKPEDGVALAYFVFQDRDDEACLVRLLLNDEKHVAQAFFSPDDQVREPLLSLIALEKKGISVAIYTLTDKKIANALIQASRRGIRVECVVDRSYGTDRYSKVDQLANAAIPVWVGT